MRRFSQAGLYLVTSHRLSAGRSTVEIVRAALAAGVRLIELREKDINARELVELAQRVRDMTAAVGALLVINDHLDVALAVDADGVHLGQDDFPVGGARKLAPELIIGASTHSVAEAVFAEEAGASYVNIGPLFPTRTKEWTGEFLGLEGFTRILPKVSIPTTVMGGIKKRHIADLIAAGADAIAVVTAVTAADDPESAAGELLREIERCRPARRDFMFRGELHS